MKRTVRKHADSVSPGKAAGAGTWWMSSVAFHGVVLLLVPPALLSARFAPDEPTDMIVRHSRPDGPARSLFPQPNATVEVEPQISFPDAEPQIYFPEGHEEVVAPLDSFVPDEPWERRPMRRQYRDP